MSAEPPTIDQAPLDFAARQSVGGGLDHLELGGGGVAEAGDLGATAKQ